MGSEGAQEPDHVPQVAGMDRLRFVRGGVVKVVEVHGLAVLSRRRRVRVGALGLE